MKQCSHCKKEKSISEFGNRQSWCRQCYREHSRVHRSALRRSERWPDILARNNEIAKANEAGVEKPTFFRQKDIDKVK
jgi:hypothetical protein